MFRSREVIFESRPSFLGKTYPIYIYIYIYILYIDIFIYYYHYYFIFFFSFSPVFLAPVLTRSPHLWHAGAPLVCNAGSITCREQGVPGIDFAILQLQKSIIGSHAKPQLPLMSPSPMKFLACEYYARPLIVVNIFWFYIQLLDSKTQV